MIFLRTLLLLLLLQDAKGSAEVLRRRRSQTSQLPDGLAHGTRVVGQTLDVLEGEVDDLVAAWVAVQVAAGKTLQTGVVGDAVLTVWQVRTQ